MEVDAHFMSKSRNFLPSQLRDSAKLMAAYSLSDLSIVTAISLIFLIA
jgi:hypothetical protein